MAARQQREQVRLSGSCSDRAAAAAGAGPVGVLLCVLVLLLLVCALALLLPSAATLLRGGRF